MENNTPWTSIDLYYKGFHIKKSVPDKIAIDDLKATIDKYVDAGFEPSWNKDTSQDHKDTDPGWIKEGDNVEDNLGNCSKCGAPNAMSKKGNPYCSKRCWL